MKRTYLRGGREYTYTYVSNIALKTLRDKIIVMRSVHQLQGIPYSEADLNEIIEDLRLLCLDQKIGRFPQKLSSS